MVRWFCDCCGAELAAAANAVAHRIRRRYDFGEDRWIDIEVTAGTSLGQGATVWNRGHLCVDCVTRAVTEGVPR